MAAIDADPGQLRLAAKTLSVGAGEVEHIATSSRTAGMDTAASARWSGSAADAFGGRVEAAATEIGKVPAPLRDVAAALDAFATAVEQAQRARDSARALAQTAVHLPEEDGRALHAAAQQQYDAAAASATAAASTAAAAVRSATAELPATPRPLPAAELSALQADHGVGLLAAAVGIETHQGVRQEKAAKGHEKPEQEFGGSARTWNDAVVSLGAVLTTPAGARAALDLLTVESQVARTPGLVKELWGSFELAKVVSNVTPAQAMYADFVRAAMINTIYGSDALKVAGAKTRFIAGGMPETKFFEVGGRALGGLGIFSDAQTILDPKASGFDKVISGANAVGTGATLAGSLLAAQGLDVIPVVGEGVMLMTGGILAYKFVYRYRHEIGHFVTSTVPHVASTVVHDVGHALNPTNWF